ncbi:MAG: hypothetical protein Athens071426_178 [Parcubacteria group bacterium Athens0714_26]|nr:MAG: hypothetical protein Athens071426_178 [Parcubacteria group bacterium Athens0714_26]
MFKEFFLERMLEKELKNLPAEQKDKIIKALSENPDFFKNIAEEFKKEINSGKSQFEAASSVMDKNKIELMKILNSDNKF